MSKFQDSFVFIVKIVIFIPSPLSTFGFFFFILLDIRNAIYWSG